MSRVRSLLASLALATAAAACAPAVHSAAPTTPAAAPAAAPEAAPQVEIDRAALRAKLATRRAQTFARFLAYRDARVYPVNQLPGGGFRHVWVDAGGNLCAAATLVSQDWGREVALRIGADNVELRLADAEGELLDWVLTTGMTQAELVAIQVPGFAGRRPELIQPREREIERLYQLYVDVERQVRSLWDKNLDLAVDALMKRPELAREVLAGRIASAGHYARAVASK